MRGPQTIRDWMEAVVDRLVRDEKLLLVNESRRSSVVVLLDKVVEAAKRRDEQLTVPEVSSALLDAEKLVEDLFCDDDELYDVLEQEKSGPQSGIRLPVVPTPARLEEKRAQGRFMKKR